MNTTDILEKLLYLTQQPSMVYMNHVEVKNDPIFETMKLLQIQIKVPLEKLLNRLIFHRVLYLRLLKIWSWSVQFKE